MSAQKIRRLVVWALVLTLALVGGWLGYQYGLSNVIANRLADKTMTELREQWREDGPSATPGAPIHIRDGQAFAILRIPALGDDYAWPIASGMGSLGGGLAWYPATAQPGQIGNFAVAGQRITAGAPFARLLDLAVGDQLIVETRDVTYHYSVVVAPTDLTVAADAGWVLDPVPGKDDVVPWQPIITLTTAQDRMLSNDRSVAFGVLTSKEVKS